VSCRALRMAGDQDGVGGASRTRAGAQRERASTDHRAYTGKKTQTFQKMAVSVPLSSLNMKMSGDRTGIDSTYPRDARYMRMCSLTRGHNAAV